MAEEKKAVEEVAKADKPKKNAKPSFGERIKKFFRDYKSEFKKINWPTWNFTVKQTGVVVIAIVIISACLFVLDTSFNAGLQALASLI